MPMLWILIFIKCEQTGTEYFGGESFLWKWCWPDCVCTSVQMCIHFLSPPHLHMRIFSDSLWCDLCCLSSCFTCFISLYIFLKIVFSSCCPWNTATFQYRKLSSIIMPSIRCKYSILSLTPLHVSLCIVQNGTTLNIKLKQLFSRGFFFIQLQQWKHNHHYQSQKLLILSPKRYFMS